MEEDIRPLTERDRKILNEARKVQKLRREQGCRLVDCGVVINNTNLRIEIIDLKRKIREQEKEIKQNRKYWGNKIAEYHKIIEFMAKELAVCGGFDYVEFGMSTGDFNKDIKNMIDYFRKKAKGE